MVIAAGDGKTIVLQLSPACSSLVSDAGVERLVLFVFD